MLAVRGVSQQRPREVASPAPDHRAPIAAPSPVSCPLPPPPPAPPPPPPAPEPPHPELSSPDGYRVLDHGFPAISADDGKVAIMVRGSAGQIELGIFDGHSDEEVEMAPIIESGELDHASAQPIGASLADRIATRIAAANKRIAKFVTMPGTELGLTREEVLGMREHASTLQVGELAVHHQGALVSVRRIADPRDVLLDWVEPAFDTTGACVYFVAAAYTANNVLVMRFDHARCADRPSSHHVFALDDAHDGEPVPSAASAAADVDLGTGAITGFPAISPDGSTIAIDAPPDPSGDSVCVLNLLRASDGHLMGTLPTVPAGEPCAGQLNPPSPAKQALLRALAARFTGWRSLRQVGVRTVDGSSLWFHRGRRLWQFGFVPSNRPPAREGGECSAWPRLAGFSAWHVRGQRVLLSGAYSTGGCMCNNWTQEVQTVPGFDGP